MDIFFQNINPDTYSIPYPPHTHTHIHIDFWQAPSHFHAFISELNSGLTLCSIRSWSLSFTVCLFEFEREMMLSLRYPIET